MPFLFTWEKSVPLAYEELCEIVEKGYIRGVVPEYINGASIDVRLGDKILVEANTTDTIVDIKTRTGAQWEEVTLTEEGYLMEPNEFVLSGTIEKFYLPNNLVADFRLNSSGARNALDAALAMWCDQMWQGSALTLELKNNWRLARLKLTPGMKVGQMIFHWTEPVPEEKSYKVRGHYNGDAEVSAAKKYSKI